MKQVVVLLAALFMAVLAMVVGQRLSTEAMAVVVGVVCGVAASVPVSLGLLLVLGRLPGRVTDSSAEPERRRETPPVVVVTPGVAQPTWPGLGHGGLAAWPFDRPPLRERNFRIIGGDAEVIHEAQGV